MSSHLVCPMSRCPYVTWHPCPEAEAELDNHLETVHGSVEVQQKYIDRQRVLGTATRGKV